MTRIKPYIPALIWMAVIFVLSTSFFGSALTKGIISRVMEFFDLEYNAQSLDTIDFFIRKSAHLVVYAVLAILWYDGLTKGSRMSIAKAALTVLAISVLWAASDEIHQYLGGERTGKVSDVVLDSVGAALSLVIFGTWMERKKKNAALKRRFKTYYKDRKLNF